VTTWFFAAVVASQVALFAAMVPVLRLARHGTGAPVLTGRRWPRRARRPPAGRDRPLPGRLIAGMEVLLVAAALAIPAAMITDAVPWWRTGRAGLLFCAVTAAVLAVATLAVVTRRLFSARLGPMGVVAALVTAVVGVDLLTGARLQLNGVTGYSTLEGGRFAGLGSVGLGLVIAGTLITAGTLAQQVRQSRRPAVLALVGGLAVVIVGNPYLGHDVVGAVALAVGVCVAAAISAGGWLTPHRVAWAALAGLVVTVGFALVDLRRPAAQRDSFGRFLTALGDGTAGAAIERAVRANIEALTGDPLTVLALASVVLVWFALLRPWGGLTRLFGLYPAVRAAMAGTAVASVIAGLLSGAALTVAGAAAALAVPLALLCAYRVVSHAGDRTPPSLAQDR
jgi:hypothetical protein